MIVTRWSSRVARATVSALLLAAAFAAPLAAHASGGSDPKARALEIYKTFKNKDWNKLYDLSAMPAAAAKEKNARKDFVNGIAGELEKNEASKKQFDNVVNAMSDLKAGKPAIQGNHASVPTSSTIKMNGKTLQLHGRVVLVKQGSEWKWDLTSGDPKQIEKASSEVFMYQPPTAK